MTSGERLIDYLGSGHMSTALSVKINACGWMNHNYIDTIYTSNDHRSLAHELKKEGEQDVPSFQAAVSFRLWDLSSSG